MALYARNIIDYFYNILAALLPRPHRFLKTVRSISFNELTISVLFLGAVSFHIDYI
ncbi:hypothetical protein [Polaribacter sp. HaHaR_3_91]|uniref:hypothetical protein n=1 Tax=Polaribacter sp. HaHaR_3_91 TaxID=2745561 RepID=UPI001C4EA926|nr:hypothetical protein [Polaribacter sp. HaHaR_3_91]QXP62550.1 hypothetical protein H0I27_11755 [Polaribacter sp. HaHaR_3_91]